MPHVPGESRLIHTGPRQPGVQALASGRRRRKRSFGWNVVVLVLWLAGPLSAVGPAAGVSAQQDGAAGAGGTRQANGLQAEILASDRMRLELRVPDFHLDEVEIGGRQYLALSVPGLDSSAAPGQPALPHAAALIGLPPAGGWSARIVESDRQVLPLAYPLAPAPAPLVAYDSSGGMAIPPHRPPAAGESTAAADGFSPTSVVELGAPALLRDLRVARLGLNPFRYNPSRQELEVIRHLVVEVRFENATAGGTVLSDSWDPILEQAVINADVARAWRGLHQEITLAASNPPATTPGSFKVEVDADGLYQLTYEDLAAAGFPTGTTDPRNLHLLLAGQESAVRIEGEADGRLDPDDRLLFYGQAAQSRYTGVNVYWLVEDGTPGLRMAQRNVAPQSGFPSAPTYRATTHVEENHLYDPAYPEANGDHWYWADLDFLQTDCPDAAQIFGFGLPSLSSLSEAATLRTSLQAYTLGTHHLTVWLNGQPLGDLIWSGTTRQESTFSFQSSLLESGQNELRLENGDCPPPPPPSPSPNGTYFNYFEVSYPADLTAVGDVLDFYGQAGDWQYELAGFSASGVALLDITDAAAPDYLAGGSVEPGYRLVFADSAGQPRRYLAQGQGAIRTPRAFYRDEPSDLASPANSADYVLIGYGEFLTATQPLLALRTSQGLQALSLDVQDVYDEFSYGLLDPGAIKDFMAYALANWQRPPAYALLVGDGTMDFRDYLGNGWHNFMPAYPADVDPWLGETASDNQLAAVLGDDNLPDLNLGRLPVSSAPETGEVVAKIVEYETAPVPGTWNQQALFVADDADYGGDFEALSDSLYGDHLPAPFTGTRVYLATQPGTPYEYDPADPAQVEAARAALQDQFSAGKLLVSFFGHSSHSQWALEILLHRDHVPDLRNGRRLPVVLSMTCYTGAFQHPPYAPLDERLFLEPGGGAVATWGPTGAGVTAGHAYLAQGFFDAVFARDQADLGAATLAGKMLLYTASPVATYLIDTYALLGDPAMSLHLELGTTYEIYLPLIMESP
jgi:hypothetical protein